MKHPIPFDTLCGNVSNKRPDEYLSEENEKKKKKRKMQTCLGMFTR
jgi:hypothetical protein